MSTNIRFRLKQETQAKHDELDRQISALELANAEHYALFLSLHRVCFEELARAVGCEGSGHAQLSDLAKHLAADASALAIELPSVEAPSLGSVDSLAARYVLGGSRLGSKILRSRWATASDERIARAGSYLSLPYSTDEWRLVCAELAALPPGGRRARCVESDTMRIFDLFLSVLASLKTAEVRKTVKLQ